MPRCFLFIVFALLAQLAGCGPSNRKVPGQSDPAKAREALIRALDGWRSGAKLEALQTSQPPIIVSDEDWRRGDQLVSYALQGDALQFGNSMRFNATLVVRGTVGGPQRKLALYEVATDPVLTVNRNDADD